MNGQQAQADDQRVTSLALQIALKLVLTAIVVVWAFMILEPFIIPVLWAVILAVALNPIYLKLKGALGGRGGMAATVFALVVIGVVAYPSYQIGGSLVNSVRELEASVEAGTLQVPPPPEWVEGLPVVGEGFNDSWVLASENLDQALLQLQPQVQAFARWSLGFLAGVGGMVIMTFLALVIAGVMLAYQEPGVRALRRITARIQGEWDEDFVSLAGATIASVAKGVLGVAVIQSALCALGLFVAGVPAAGLFTIGVLILAIIQLPPILLMILPIIWSFGNLPTVWAVVFTIWTIVASASDTPLKAIFLGRGVSVPMPVVLLGAIGGMVSMGMMGLFLGAVVLGIAYKLFQVWLGGGSLPEVPAEEGAGA
jgi:predicted PurR-regulated permease PerM